MEEQKAALAKRDDASLSDDERQLKQQADQILAAYKQMGEQQSKAPTDEEIDQMAMQLANLGRKINAVAASDKHLYCTAPASKGFGYSVWRTGLDFSEPKRIVDGLSGCCGQMDIQCCGDDVVVSENSAQTGRPVRLRWEADFIMGKSQPRRRRRHVWKLLQPDEHARGWQRPVRIGF